MYSLVVGDSEASQLNHFICTGVLVLRREAEVTDIFVVMIDRNAGLGLPSGFKDHDTTNSSNPKHEDCYHYYNSNSDYSRIAARG